MWGLFKGKQTVPVKPTHQYRTIVVWVRNSYCSYEIHCHDQPHLVLSRFYKPIAEVRCTAHASSIGSLGAIIDDKEEINGNIFIPFGRVPVALECPSITRIGISRGFTTCAAWSRDSDNYLWLQRVQELVKKEIANGSEMDIFKQLK